MKMIKYLEKANDFEAWTKEKCLVDFFADWCGPCKMLGTVLESAQEEIGIPIIKINTDKFPELSAQFGVMSIPTVLLMENSKEVSKHIGYMQKEELLDFVK